MKVSRSMAALELASLQIIHIVAERPKWQVSYHYATKTHRVSLDVISPGTNL